MSRGQAPLNEHPLDKLLAVAQEKLGVDTRTQVHLLSGLHAPWCSKVRKGKIDASAEMVLRLHDATEVPVAQIREMLGVKKFVYIPPVAQNAQLSGAQQAAQNEGSN